jgi:hypothetical protein
MKTFMLLLLSVFLSAVTVPTSAIAGPKSVGGEHLPFEAVKMIIEFNSDGPGRRSSSSSSTPTKPGRNVHGRRSQRPKDLRR